MASSAEFPDYVCRNPHCKSYGHSHPNCRCGPPGTKTDFSSSYHSPGLAHGGVVHHCHGPHSPDCQYYLAGGDVRPLSQPQEDPSITLGNAAAEHGLLGILKSVGRPNMVDPQKHAKVLHEAKNQDHEKAADHMHGHALVGGAGKGHLKEIMDHMAGPMMIQEPHPEAFRGSVDYLSTSRRGKDRIDQAMNGILSRGKHAMPEPIRSHMDLKEHLNKLESNPEMMLDISGSMSHYLPGHSAQIAATAAQAVSYLNGIKPRPIQNAPLDRISKVSPAEEMKYDRQLSIAQQPLSVLAHMKNGTLQPQDIETVQAIFPSLYKTLVSKATEKLIDHMASNQEVPYHQRTGLSLLLGQPLDGTMTPNSMQAIMKANAGAQKESQPQKGGNKKASDVELKQINKVDAMFETPLEARQINKRR